MANYALVNSSGNVLQIIEWDGQTYWIKPSNVEAVLDPVGNVMPGFTYDGQFFNPPQGV